MAKTKTTTQAPDADLDRLVRDATGDVEAIGMELAKRQFAIEDLAIRGLALRLVDLASVLAVAGDRQGEALHPGGDAALSEAREVLYGAFGIAEEVCHG